MQNEGVGVKMHKKGFRLFFGLHMLSLSQSNSSIQYVNHD